MLVNEELKDLSAADLNQRYGDCYVNYGGDVRYIHSMKQSSYGMMVEFQRADGPWLEPFDWSKMDTFRPAPKMLETAGSVFWCSYHHQRQWCRGFSFGKTCEAYCLYQNDDTDYKKIVEQWLKPETKAKITVEDLTKSRRKVMSRSLAFIRGMVYYRTLQVGEVVNARQIRLIHNKYRQEVSEYVEPGVELVL